MDGNILVVDDEQEIADLVEVYLKKEGYHVYKFYTGREAMKCVEEESIDLAILDLMLPDMSGFEICQKIRENHTYPIIMLTAKDEEYDKINGLMLGADDYVTKPFLPLELVARVKAQLRRYFQFSNAKEKKDSIITISGLVIDLENRECTLNEKPLLLTPTEYEILRILAENRGKVVSAEELFREIWKDEYYVKSNNTITVHVRHLREKMKDNAENPKYIKTVWGWDIKLKNSGKKKSTVQYIPIKRKIFFKMVSSALLVAVFSIFLYSSLRGNTAAKIINFFDKYIVLSGYSDSRELYSTLISSNLSKIINGYLIFCFIVALLISLWRISNYVTELFEEVNQGLETLSSKEKSTIALPTELEFMEDSMKESKEIISRREEEARTAEQRKNDLVVYLAHDIKTPLTSVIGYLSLLEEAPELPTELRAKYLNITLDKALRLEELINEFFEITRYNLQKVELENETIDLYYMLFQMADEFYPILFSEEKQIELHMEETLTLRGDSDKLARVFNNVLKNAISYSNPDSIIHIFAEEIDEQIVIRFQNQGKTIPKQKLDSIFEKFFRLDEARSSTTGGAGLGLAIAKEIVELHSGTIHANSEDGITTFIITIPKNKKTT